MQSILTQKNKLKGKKVLLRLSLNVPVDDGKVINDFKLEKILPTIEFLRNEGAKVLILGYAEKKKDTLTPVGEYFKQFLPAGRQVLSFKFVENILDEKNREIISEMKGGGVILFENLKKYNEEVNNNEEFSKIIASLGDIYVNEAFPDSHRKYSSIIGVPKLMESYFGPLFIKETESLCCVGETQALKLLVLGGNKLKTKLPFVKKFLEITDYVFVGGSLANDFFKLKGYEVGESLVSNGDFGLEEVLNNKKIILPIDVIVQNPEGIFERKVNEVLKDDVILDAGPRTIQLLEEKIKQSKFVLWNGPIGDYKTGFIEGTLGLAQAIAGSDAESVAGGGDTVFCIDKLGLKDKFDFLSTGGGAMLEYISNKTLVGIEAVKNK